MKNEWILPPLAWHAHGQIYLLTFRFHVPIMQLLGLWSKFTASPFFPPDQQNTSLRTGLHFVKKQL